MRRRYRWNPDTARLEETGPSQREYGSLIMTDLPGYQSPVTGKWIEGRKARREDLARTGSRPYEGIEQERKEAAKWHAEREAKLDRRLEASTHETLNHMPERYRRALLDR